MRKIDYKKTLSEFYGPSAKKVAAADVPALNFLMIDGRGKPESAPFKEAVETLFPVAYTLKFMAKKGALGVDYAVMPLEGLWWADDMSDFIAGNKDSWKWTLMIMQPDFISGEMVDDAVSQVKNKKDPPGLAKLRFDRFAEGKAAQILHIGPFAAEGPTVQAVHQFIVDSGNRLSGKHHEIYLSDFRKTAPEKLKTVIRQPFAADVHGDSQATPSRASRALQ